MVTGVPRFTLLKKISDMCSGMRMQPLGRRAWEAWRSARALARRRLEKYRFDEGRTLRAAGFRRAGAVACCWQVTRSARRGQGRRRPSPGPDMLRHAPGPSGIPPLQPPRPDHSVAARSHRSRRRFGSPAERASLATGQGESRGAASYGWERTLYFLEGKRSQGVGGARYVGSRGMGSRTSFSPRGEKDAWRRRPSEPVAQESPQRP